jgi:hypothetical protein
MLRFRCETLKPHLENDDTNIHIYENIFIHTFYLKNDDDNNDDIDKHI